LFGTKDLSFVDVPTLEALENLMASKPPFNNVNIVLITHDHVDHFDADLVTTFLDKNIYTELIGTDQVVDRLKTSNMYEKLKDRIHAITPTFGSSRKLNLNGIDIIILRLKHCTYFVNDEKTGKKIDRHRYKQNNGYIIKLGNYRILHTGDSGMDDFKEYQDFHLRQAKIDVAFLGSLFWSPYKPKFEIVNKYIQPNHIVLMHLDKGNKEKYFSLRNEYKDKLIAPIIIFKTSLENKIFNRQ
jgi:L-ascorbate metabolism protein UlaG (beta-lactamase superfamily)